MDSTLVKPAFAAGKTTVTLRTVLYWTVTALFCLQMGFTAYAQLRLPQVAETFTHFGFPAYFRVEFSWAKILGLVLLLAPVTARLKEWAYPGFAITLASALCAFCDGRRPPSVGLGRGHWCAVGGLLCIVAHGAARTNPQF